MNKNTDDWIDKLFSTIVKIIIIAIILILIVTVMQCEDEPVCKTDEMRCNGSIIEYCNADGQWDPVVNCRDLEASQTCCMAEEGPSCKEMCNE